MATRESLVAAWICVVTLATLVSAAGSHRDVLFWKSAWKGVPYEKVVLEQDGWNVVLCDQDCWKERSDFSRFRAIVIVETPTSPCPEGPPQGVMDSALTWGPAITGNSIIWTLDPNQHRGWERFDKANAFAAIRAGLRVALSSSPGTTGAYISLACYGRRANLLLAGITSPPRFLASSSASPPPGYTARTLRCTHSICREGASSAALGRAMAEAAEARSRLSAALSKRAALLASGVQAGKEGAAAAKAALDRYGAIRAERKADEKQKGTLAAEERERKRREEERRLATEVPAWQAELQRQAGRVAEGVGAADREAQAARLEVERAEAYVRLLREPGRPAALPDITLFERTGAAEAEAQKREREGEGEFDVVAEASDDLTVTPLGAALGFEAGWFRGWRSASHGFFRRVPPGFAAVLGGGGVVVAVAAVAPGPSAVCAPGRLVEFESELQAVLARGGQGGKEGGLAAYFPVRLPPEVLEVDAGSWHPWQLPLVALERTPPAALQRSGPAAEGSAADLLPEGRHRFSLTVTDPYGLSATCVTEVEVRLKGDAAAGTDTGSGGSPSSWFVWPSSDNDAGAGGPGAAEAATGAPADGLSMFLLMLALGTIALFALRAGQRRGVLPQWRHSD